MIRKENLCIQLVINAGKPTATMKVLLRLCMPATGICM
jgi:hypothetical protein